jgi:hypothetical protein
MGATSRKPVSAAFRATVNRLLGQGQ